MSDRDRVRLTSSSEELLERYSDWLVVERRLAASTIKYYVRDARRFLAERDAHDLATLSLGEVSAFVVGECRRRSMGSAKNLSTALRSLLRYLHLEGIIDRELAQAVPARASWRGGGLPRGLGADELTALLASGDNSTAIGRRDHAIVVLLARLGLRAGEVASLTLDDLDWTDGEMVIRGKGNRTDSRWITSAVTRTSRSYHPQNRIGRRHPGQSGRGTFTSRPAAAYMSTPSSVGHTIAIGELPFRAPPIDTTSDQLMQSGGALSRLSQVLPILTTGAIHRPTPMAPPSRSSTIPAESSPYVLTKTCP